MSDYFEINFLPCALLFGVLVYAFEPFDLPEHLEEGSDDSLIPIKANGRDIRVPSALVDVTSDISKFATNFELALKKAVPELPSTGGSMWTVRIVRGKRPELEDALEGMDELRRNYSALLDRAVDAYDRGKVIKEDLRGYRKKQRAKTKEIQELMKEYWPRDSSWTLL